MERMSSPPNHQQQSPPVVQTILESFTRCFNPLEPCTKVCSSSQADGAPAARRSSGAGTPTSQLFGLNIGSAADGLSSRAVSRSHSSSDSRKKAAAASYDADGVARAKRSHHKLMVSPAALEEKSMKRKLEIFRGTMEEANCRPRLAPRSRQGSRQDPSPPSSGRSSPEVRHDLLLSDDEQELVRVQSRKRFFACGMNMERIQNHSPISSVAKFFTEAQKPFGLCFATPVRTASQEDIANLSDDKLTDDEFLRRHAACGGGGDNALVTPNDQDQHSSYNEEETITSTLYFDQKYSHVVQTRPPMPLFQEHMVDSKEDELTEIIKRRSGDAPPMEMVTSKTRKKDASRGSSRASPFRVSAKGGAHSPRSSPFRGSPFRSSKTGSPRGSPFQEEPHKPAPSPVRIHTESMSIGTASAESHESNVERIEVQKLLEPDIVLHSTAAEF